MQVPSALPSIQTERLLLRAFTLDDAPDVQRYAGDYDIARMTMAIPHPYEDGMAEEWIGTHEAILAEGSEMTWAIQSLQNGGLMGAMGLTIKEASQAAELGYWIGKPFWNHGYATEAATAIVKCGFEVVGLHRIYSRHYTHNPASGRVMQKIGMQYEGTLRHIELKDGQWRDFAHYSILESEYAG